MAKRFIRSKATRFVTVLGLSKSSRLNVVGFGDSHVGTNPVWPTYELRLADAEEKCKSSHRKSTLRLDYLDKWQVDYLKQYVARAEMYEGRKITVTDLVSLAINQLYAVCPLPEPEGKNKHGS